MQIPNRCKKTATILRPDKIKGLNMYVDVDYAGNWDTREAISDVDTDISRHG